MTNRLGADAFSYYVSLGAERSYEAVAERFGVSVASVVNLAAEENWQARVEEVDRRPQESAEANGLELIEETKLKQIRIVKVIQARALKALQSMPFDSADAAVRALVESVKLERMLRGQPSERTVVDIEEGGRHERAPQD